jgi:hypothetical protein
MSNEGSALTKAVDRDERHDADDDDNDCGGEREKKATGRLRRAAR